MRILLIGDPHFKINNAYESDQFISEIYKLILPPEESSFRDEKIKKKNKYDKIIILGDILDTHEKIHMRPFCRATEFIINLSKISPTYVLIGNHDRINNSVFLTDEHPFNGLASERAKNIFIIDKVLEEDGFLYVPYVPTGRFDEALKTVPSIQKNGFKKENYKVIFAHQEFQGSIFQDQGDIPPKDIPIYSGHIHNYRKMGNVTYVGTPFQHSFYDNPDKFVMELNIKDNIDLNKTNIFNKIREEKITLNIIKKRIEEINISKLADYKVNENYMTKLIIKGDRKLLKAKEHKILKHPNITYKLSYLLGKKDEDDIKKEFKNIKFEDMLKERLEKESKVINILYERIKKKIK
jgi:hypothetical protein